MMEAIGKSRASYVAHLDEEKQKNNNLVAALKDAEQQLKTEHLQWQEDKFSLLQELEKTQQQLESLQESREESSILQATEGLEQTVQEKGQEPVKPGRSLRFELPDLDFQIPEKKKKKWYKELMPSSRTPRFGK